MDPNLLNQLLGLLNRHRQSVAGNSLQPTDWTMYLQQQFQKLPTTDSMHPYDPYAGSYGGFNPYGNKPSVPASPSRYDPNAGPYGGFFPSSGGVGMPAPRQPIDTNYLPSAGGYGMPAPRQPIDPYGTIGIKPSLPPTPSVYDPNAGPYGGFFPRGGGVGMPVPPMPTDPYGTVGIQYGDARNPPPFTQPASSKWVLGPGGGTYYNDELRRYNGYVPPTPTGKYSVRPMNPQFVRDPYAGSY